MTVTSTANRVVTGSSPATVAQMVGGIVQLVEHLCYSYRFLSSLYDSVAQWWSGWLLTRGMRVQIPPESPIAALYITVTSY